MRAQCQPRLRKGRAAGFRVVQSDRKRWLRQGFSSTQENRKRQGHAFRYEGTEIVYALSLVLKYNA